MDPLNKRIFMLKKFIILSILLVNSSCVIPVYDKEVKDSMSENVIYDNVIISAPIYFTVNRKEYKHNSYISLLYNKASKEFKIKVYLRLKNKGLTFEEHPKVYLKYIGGVHLPIIKSVKVVKMYLDPPSVVQYMEFGANYELLKSIMNSEQTEIDIYSKKSIVKGEFSKNYTKEAIARFLSAVFNDEE